MNLSLTPEQELLQQSVSRFVEREYSFQQRQEILKTDVGFSQTHWQTIIELGWLGVSFEEEFGGLGGSAIDTMLICEQFGRALILEPYLPNLLSGEILRRCKNNDSAVDYIGELLSGATNITCALYEPNSRFTLSNIATSATLNDDVYYLNGTKTPVLYGHSADHMIVSAQLSGANNESGLFIVNTNAEGISTQRFQTIDGQHAALVSFNDVVVSGAQLLLRGEQVDVILKEAVSTVLVGYCAEALGAMELVLQMTMDYCQQRQQFNQPISRFQVIQHRLADMYIDCEAVRSLLYAAAIKTSEQADDAYQSVAALKFSVAEKGRKIAEEAVQLHGAIGFTEELALNHYYKRLVSISVLFGDADFYLKEFYTHYSTD